MKMLDGDGTCFSDCVFIYFYESKIFSLPTALNKAEKKLKTNKKTEQNTKRKNKKKQNKQSN